MTYAARFRELVPDFGHEAPTRSDAVANKVGIMRRIFDAIIESRQKQVDRSIARFLAQSGGRLTDDMEREMMERLFKGNWNPHR